MIVSGIHQAQRQTTRASPTILAAEMVATGHARVATHTGVDMEPLPERCTVKTVEGRGGENKQRG